MHNFRDQHRGWYMIQLTNSETLQLSLEAAPKYACLCSLHPQPADILILCLGPLHCWKMNPEFPKKRQLRRLGLLDAALQCCTLWLNDRQSLFRFSKYGCVCVCVCGGGGVGGVEWGVLCTIKEDHGSDGYKNFVFPSHENNQVRCSFY